MNVAQDAEVFRVARLGRTGLIAEYTDGMKPRQMEMAARAITTMTNEQIAALILNRRPQQGRQA